MDFTILSPTVADSVASHTLKREILNNLQKYAKRVGGDAVGDPGTGCEGGQQTGRAPSLLPAPEKS